MSFAASLARVGPDLDPEVPDSYDSGTWCVGGGLACIHGVVAREPFFIQAAGDRFGVTDLFHYMAEGNFLIIYGSCGKPDNTKRRANFSYSTAVSWDTSWTIRLLDGKAHVDPVDRCEVTLGGIDVTDQAMGVLNRVLEKLPDKANDRARAATARFRPQAESAWKALQRPIVIDTSHWVSIQPDSFVVTPLNARNEVVRAEAGVFARTRLVHGAAPDPDTIKYTALPSLRIGTPGDSFRVVPRIYLPFHELNALVSAKIKGLRRTKAIPILPDPWVEVDSTRVYGVADNLAIGVHVKGSVSGWLYVLGRLSFDCVTERATIDWVEYDIESRSVLLRFARWLVPSLLDKAVRSALTSVSWDAGPRFRELEAGLSKAMNGPVGGDVKLVSTIKRLEVREHFTDDTSFVFAFAVGGKSEVQVSHAGAPLPTGDEARVASLYMQTLNDDKDAEDPVDVSIERGGVVVSGPRALGQDERWGNGETQGPFSFRLPDGITRQNCSALKVHLRKRPAGSATGKQWNASFRGTLWYADGSESTKFQTPRLEIGDGHPYDLRFTLCP
jgi:hypothetical protein